MPDLNDFVAGIKTLLRPGGRRDDGVPASLRLVEANQFDTIYHEHFCYFSFLTVSACSRPTGWRLFDVEELPRTAARCASTRATPTTGIARRPSALASCWRASGPPATRTSSSTARYARRVEEAKRRIARLPASSLKRAGKTIAGYGAPAKGNTLLNYCGVRTDFIDFTVDRNPQKQGRFLPGTHIPIRAPEAIREARPDVVLILPWNLREEIMEQLAYIREWGGQFAARAPELTLFP